MHSAGPNNIDGNIEVPAQVMDKTHLRFKEGNQQRGDYRFNLLQLDLEVW